MSEEEHEEEHEEAEKGEKKEDDDDDDDDGGGDDGAPSKGKRPPDSIMVQRKSARASASSAGSAAKSDSDNNSAASMIMTIGGLVAFAAVVLGVVGFIVYKVTQSTENKDSTIGGTSKGAGNASTEDGGGLIAFFHKIAPQKVRKDVRRGPHHFLVFAEAPDIVDKAEQLPSQNYTGGSNNHLDVLDNV